MSRIAWASTLIALAMATSAMPQTAPPPPPPSKPTSVQVRVSKGAPADTTSISQIMMMMMLMQSSQQEEQLKKVIVTLKESLSIDEQQKINLIMVDLNHLPDETRFLLAASINVCGMKVIDCRGLSHDIVKPVVAVSLEEQKVIRENADSRRNFFMSVGSFGISFASLVLSFLAFRRKAKEPSAAPEIES